MKKINLVLICIHVVVGLNALAGGYYGLTGAPQVPLSWLEGSPFSDYFFPSLFLMVVVGGTQLMAAFSLITKKSFALTVSLIAGILLLVWIGIQVWIIGYVSWLQPAMVILSLVTISGSMQSASKSKDFETGIEPT